MQHALVYQRVETLANLSYDVTGLAAHLEDERDQTMEYIGEGTNGRLGTLAHNPNQYPTASQNLALVTQEQSLTAPWVDKVRTESTAVGSGYPAQVVQNAQNIGDVLKLLVPLRTAATTTDLPAVDVPQVEAVLATMAQIPPRRIQGDDRERLRRLRDELAAVVFGQDEAIDRLVAAIQVATLT